MTPPRGFHLWANLSYPVAWSALIMLLAGELGASCYTLPWSYWLLTWLSDPSQETLWTFNVLLRKGGHLLFYAILFLLWCRAFQRELGWSRGQATLAGLGLCLVLALLDETWQSGTPGRHASYGDVLLDLTAAGMAALLSWKRWRTPPPAPPSEDCRTRLV